MQSSYSHNTYIFLERESFEGKEKVMETPARLRLEKDYLVTMLTKLKVSLFRNARMDIKMNEIRIFLEVHRALIIPTKSDLP